MGVGLEKVIVNEIQTPGPERQAACFLSSEASTSKSSDLSTFPGVTAETRKVKGTTVLSLQLLSICIKIYCQVCIHKDYCGFT